MSKRLYREYDEEGNLIKKECSKCGEIKSVVNFYKNKTHKDELSSCCKECVSIYRKNLYLKNKDKTLEQSHEYYINNREKVLERQYQYHIKNKQKILDYHHQHYENNKEKIKEYTHLYHINNKQKRAAYAKKYRKQNKEKISEHYKNFYNDKVNQFMIEIYENFTKNSYPNKGTQYGIIYGIHCKVTDRWYIGQTRTTFNIRYHRNFFNCKNRELSEDNQKLKLLQDDIEKYGKENFEIFEVLDVAFSEKELDEKEAYYIDYYKAYDEGYNSNRGNIFKHNKSKRKEVI